MALLIVEHMPTLRALLEVAEITQEDSCQRLWSGAGSTTLSVGRETTAFEREG